MARDIADIQQGMVDTIQNDDVLKERLSSTSKTARWRLKTYVVAVAIWLLEVLFDKHKAETDTKLAEKGTHNELWYANKAKSFQYGHALIPETDKYETIDEDAQIIKQASVDAINGKLYIKVAKEVDGGLVPLSTADPDELSPFTEYVKRYRDAVAKVEIVSSVGDDLRIVADIYYDAMVLNANGQLLNDPSRKPVEETLNKFITSLPFNGEFIPVALQDAWQETEGVAIPEILSVETKYAANDWQSVQGKVIPNAGYLKIEPANLTLNYKANV